MLVPPLARARVRGRATAHAPALVFASSTHHCPRGEVARSSACRWRRSSRRAACAERPPPRSTGRARRIGTASRGRCGRSGASASLMGWTAEHRAQVALQMASHCGCPAHLSLTSLLWARPLGMRATSNRTNGGRSYLWHPRRGWRPSRMCRPTSLALALGSVHPAPSRPMIRPHPFRSRDPSLQSHAHVRRRRKLCSCSSGAALRKRLPNHAALRAAMKFGWQRISLQGLRGRQQTSQPHHADRCAATRR